MGGINDIDTKMQTGHDRFCLIWSSGISLATLRNINDALF